MSQALSAQSPLFTAHMPSSRGRPRGQDRAQSGYSLVEVSIVMAIVLLLAIIAIPTVRAYVIESKVPKVGEELARFITHTRVNASSTSAGPYTAVANTSLANMLRESGLFAITGSAASPTVRHGLGGDGEVNVAPADSGEAFTLTLTKVNHAACPTIASMLQRLADTVTLTPQGGSASTLKDATTSYNALETEQRCSQGDSNTFSFKVS